MFYYLAQWLDELNVPGMGMFSYTSFRALLVTITALTVSFVVGNWFINMLRRRQIGETARDASIDPFGVAKAGVPTMGGIIIITAIIVPLLLFGKLHSTYLILMLVTTICLGTLGFVDDYVKVFRKHKDGLRPRFKILAQVAVGFIVGLTLYYAPSITIRENNEVDTHQGISVTHDTQAIKSTQTTIPFVKGNNLDYLDAFNWIEDDGVRRKAGWALFVVITIIVVMAVSNGANLNDGMDGMATGNSAIIGIALGVLAYVSSHIEFAAYLNIMFIPGSEELVIFMCAFVGALIGFLWYNSYPAQVFMGDTGSLTIGGIIAVVAILIHKELLLPLLCGVFLVENLSVILQTQYFKWGKRRGRKQRIFKRTPIHDHFRTGVDKLDSECTYLFTMPQKLHHENKITIRFWIITILLATITIITLKIR